MYCILYILGKSENVIDQLEEVHHCIKQLNPLHDGTC